VVTGVKTSAGDEVDDDGSPTVTVVTGTDSTIVTTV
jgi:hypothetical protein